jgi:hypothetical protein
MPNSKPFPSNPSSWHVAVAAEAIAAGQFARCGFDVSVQYGADQPEYDLIVAQGENMLKVSVKGSQDLGWGLTQSYMRKATEISGKRADYQGAIDLWLKRHDSWTVFCLVQFGNVPIDQMPRIYLATAKEVAATLRATKGGRGDSVLNEDHTLKRGRYTGTTEKLPASWKISKDRIQELLADRDAGLSVGPRVRNLN